jgi:hypothetical protein
MIIGLMGEKESGKSSVATILAEEGFTILEPGMQVMELLLDIDPYFFYNDYHDVMIRVREVYDHEGYMGFKQHAEGRRLLQELGTRIRERNPNFWVEQQRRVIRAAPGSVVHTSVRFPNEAHMVWRYDGYVVLVERPGLDHHDTHVSEQAWREIIPDYTIKNDGTLSDLRSTVSNLLVSFQ